MSSATAPYSNMRLRLTLVRPASATVWLVWHILAIIALAVAPIRLRLETGPDGATVLGGLVASYLATVALLTWKSRRTRNILFSDLILISCGVFGAFFLFLLVSRVEYSRSVLLVSLMIVGGFLVLSLTLRSYLQKLVLIAVALVVIVAAATAHPFHRSSSEFAIENRLIRTSLYRIVGRYYRDFGVEQVTGGALALLKDRYLLATGGGDMYVLSWDSATKQLRRKKIALRVPVNRDEFLPDAEPRKAYTRSFRAADLLVQDFGDHFRLFASHLHWDPQKHCSTVRISAIDAMYEGFAEQTGSREWETIYESVPCLQFKNKSDPFGGEQMGGKMELLDPHRILLTVGDFKYDGVESDEDLPQDSTAHYGKTILVNLDTRQASIYTIGHRNEQGLTIDSAGNIWETEHGPQGGDELNWIQEGKNYGWPAVTYGRDYGKLTWPLNPKPGRHDGYEIPSFAWVPSIGVSAVMSVTSNLFQDWKGDLLVASLGDKSLWRVRTDAGRTVLTERINIRERVRDVLQDGNGRLILWTEETELAPTKTAIVILEPVVASNPDVMVGLSSADHGELAFDQCSGCHRVEDGHSHGIGPDLKGVFGEHAAFASDYTYSDAMRAFSGSWSAKTLDAFLTDPQAVVPGTAMQFDGMSDPAERAALIDYLKEHR